MAIGCLDNGGRTGADYSSLGYFPRRLGSELRRTSSGRGFQSPPQPYDRDRGPASLTGSLRLLLSVTAFID
jgi:hypothetical protein